MSSLPWPLQGFCGACGRPARQFPSKRWEHIGVPCRARSQGMWWVDDVDIRAAIVFVPAGEPLPAAPEAWHSHVIETIPGTHFPAALGFCRVDHAASVRAFLAAEAESRELVGTDPGGGT